MFGRMELLHPVWIAEPCLVEVELLSSVYSTTMFSHSGILVLSVIFSRQHNYVWPYGTDISCMDSRTMLSRSDYCYHQQIVDSRPTLAVQHCTAIQIATLCLVRSGTAILSRQRNYVWPYDTAISCMDSRTMFSSQWYCYLKQIAQLCLAVHYYHVYRQQDHVS